MNIKITSSQNLTNSKNFKTQQNQNIQFKGLLKTKLPRYIQDHLNVSSGILNQSKQDVFQLLKGSSNKKVNFFDALVHTYNGKNYYSDVKDSSQHVNNIFKMVKKPSSNHFYIVAHMKGSFKNMEDLFRVVKGSSKRAAFARDTLVVLNKAGIDNSQLVTNLLMSKHSNKYISNFEKYKSYIVLNGKNKNVVEDLDKMVGQGLFNPQKYDSVLSNQRIFNAAGFPETSILNKKIIEQKYTEKGQEFLEAFIDNSKVSQVSFKVGNDKDILAMYTSTTKKNIEIRKSLLKSVDDTLMSEKNPEIAELRQLFDAVDKDKHVRKFIEKAIENQLNISSAKEFNTILASVPPKKLDNFFNNVKNIIHQTEGKSRIETLQKEIENPFFETASTKIQRRLRVRYGYAKKESILSKARKFVSNQFDIAVDRLSKVSKANTVQKEIEKTVAETPTVVNTFMKRTMQKAPNAKKLVVISDVNNIIEKKLGAKMLQEQKREYAIKATKMRMSMLPEIFTSIKETRAVDRAAGKVKFNSSNRDALDLYERINGKNKRLVSYMLKKRNSSGARMFEVKDIIDLLKKSEREVINAKKASPDFKAANEKAYYKQLVDAKIQQYGKI